MVKDPSRGDYFELGEEEHFLLEQLDSRRSTGEIGALFAERFGELLVDDFL